MGFGSDGTVPIGPPYILFLYQHSFARNFRLQFWVGIANPQFLGSGGRRGSEMVGPTIRKSVFGEFKQAVHSNFSSTSLRVSEILPILFSSMPLFPYPTLVSPKFPHVLLHGIRWIAFWLQRAKVLG